MVWDTQTAGAGINYSDWHPHWTPTILMLDSEGNERHRVEGYLDADDMLAQFTLGLGHIAFNAGDWKTSEQRFAEVAEKYPSSDAASEGVYWTGVSRYKATNDVSHLTETLQALNKQYPESTWAKKASVWKK
jgi:hypothetical protein